ncbi:MAG: response regulator [Bacteroidota bacterium]|nr:response regulator [Bacteroidota bacterium]
MLTEKELKKIEIELHDSGIPEHIRRSIRNSKICIIDNQLEDLKSFHDGLRREGFSNLEKFKAAPTVNQILSNKYDLIVLDLNDVATEITKDDGIGLLKLIKDREPSLPVLVVTGQFISPDVQNIISKADLLRKKPVLASDLANDVDTLMKIRKDKFWASLELLKELNRIDISLSQELSLLNRIKLHFNRKSLEKKLLKREEDIIDKLIAIFKLIKSTTSATNSILKLTNHFVNHD